MEDYNKPELATSSRLDTDLDLAKEKERDKIKQKKLKEIENYELVELDLEEEKDYASVIRAVRDDVRTLYEDAGIDLDENDFPDVHLVPKELVANLSGDGKIASESDGGFYNTETNNLYVFVKGRDRMLEDIENVYHETSHSVGRNVRVLAPELSFSAQLGHKTTSLKEVRGEVVEEGTMMYFARKFVTRSSNEVVVNARNKYIDLQRKYASTELLTELAQFDSSFQNSTLCEVGLDKKFPERYLATHRLIRSLVNKAAIMEDGIERAMNLENGLLNSRVNTKKRKDLVTQIDKLFGKGTGRVLFRLQMGYVNGINDLTKKVVGNKQ